LRELISGVEEGYDPSWSQDGRSIVLTLNVAGGGGFLPDGPGIATYDVANQKLSQLPDAKKLFSPRWSPDGRYIAAISNDSMKLMLFDRVSQQWQELISMPIGYPSWSHDGQYIYFDTTLTDDANFFRIRISDRKLERLVSLKGVAPVLGRFRLKFITGFTFCAAMKSHITPTLATPLPTDTWCSRAGPTTNTFRRAMGLTTCARKADASKM
jgi:hypothetical protein